MKVKSSKKTTASMKQPQNHSRSEDKLPCFVNHWNEISKQSDDHSESCTKSRRTISGRSKTKVSQLDSANMSEPSTPRSPLSRKSSVMSETSVPESMNSTRPCSSTGAIYSPVSPKNSNDSVKVLVRIRPPSAKELNQENQLSVHKTSDTSLQLATNEGVRNFVYDAVIGDEVSQTDFFQAHAANIVERCLSGYNGCIFAYGQTGSGKTYTMLGDVSQKDGTVSESAGIIPRVFKHLFKLLKERQEAELTGQLEFDCKCSFLEIYNETITDLLNPAKKNLHVRNDKNGARAEGLTEQAVFSTEDAMKIIYKGNSNRSVAHTQMNAESSRSHSILTCTLTVRRQNKQGCSSIFKSRLNLVDLAGSERQKLTGTTGSHLKEAAKINKSLSTLGLVILSLGETKSGKTQHVPYRDSKLTFLLQDSLGGNANAIMISNISPSTKNVNETLSTLRFAKGAKKVKNTVMVNHNFVGSVSSLKAEIILLKQELQALKQQSLIDEANALHCYGFEENEDGCMEGTVESIEQGREIEERETKELQVELASALQRETSAQRTVSNLTEEISALQFTLTTKEIEISEQRFISRNKDYEIQRLEETIKGQKESFLQEESEILRLKEEVQILKGKANKAEDAVKYAMENIRLKLELAASRWNLQAANSKASLFEQIMELQEKLFEVAEEIDQHEAFDCEELRKKARELAREIVVEQSNQLRKLMKDSRSLKQKRRESLTRRSTRWTLWFKTVLAKFTRPVARFNSTLYSVKTVSV
eukprot:g2059.t1